MNQLEAFLPVSPAAGFALLCDESGAVVQILRDDIGVARVLAPGMLFTRAIHHGSLTKALSFLVELRQRKAVFAWEMNVKIEGDVSTLHFAGGLAGDRMVIVGAADDSSVLVLYDEIISMNNDQINLLRETTKNNTALENLVPMTRADSIRTEGGMYDEISRLNNELISMQREMAKQNRELEKLNQLKNQFIGMVIHDLRSPLVVIQMFSDFLLESFQDESYEEEREFLAAIHNSSAFMTNLVNDLLDVTQIESGMLRLETTPTDLARMVRDNAQINRALAVRSGIDLLLTVQSSPALEQVNIDPYKIDQVLNNLIGNAIKFSQPGTTITVTLSLSAEGDSAVIAVRDQGIGIPEQELGLLFKPFGRTSNRTTSGEKTTGLGLFIVKNIVEGHGGRITVESQVGAGSTFTVALPINI